MAVNTLATDTYALPQDFRLGDVVDVDTEDGWEVGATVLGRSKSGNPQQIRIRFADGVEDNWAADQLLAAEHDDISEADIMEHYQAYYAKARRDGKPLTATEQHLALARQMETHKRGRAGNILAAGRTQPARGKADRYRTVQAEFVGWVKKATQAEEKAAATHDELTVQSALVKKLQAQLREAGIEPVVAVEEGVPPEAEDAVVFGRPYFEASNDLLEADIATLVAAAVKGAILASDTRQSRVPSDTHTYTSGGSEPRWRCCLATPASDHS